MISERDHIIGVAECADIAHYDRITGTLHGSEWLDDAGIVFLTPKGEYSPIAVLHPRRSVIKRLNDANLLGRQIIVTEGEAILPMSAQDVIGGDAP